MTRSTTRRALVSGASIAGPALGYWLSRNRWSVTLVARAPQVRGGGYPIDLRGTAVQAAQRMGIYDDVRQQRVGRRSTKVLNQRGRTIATIDLSTRVNDDATGDVELPPGRSDEDPLPGHARRRRLRIQRVGRDDDAAR